MHYRQVDTQQIVACLLYTGLSRIAATRPWNGLKRLQWLRETTLKQTRSNACLVEIGGCAHFLDDLWLCFSSTFLSALLSAFFSSF